MNILEAISRALEGCKRTLTSVLNSSEFEAERVRVEAFSRLDPSTDLGIAHRAGPLTMTRLLNNHSEAEALRIAAEQAGSSNLSVDITALIGMVGVELVREAGNCLTDEMLERADEWHTATPERQKAITYWLLKEFQSETQGEIDGKPLDATFERLQQGQERFFDQLYDESLDPILPALYGRWNKSTSPANCQGKTQMLAAFAQKAGARYITTHPAISHSDVSNRYIERLLRAQHLDLRTRNLYGVDAGVDEGVQCALHDCYLDKFERCFHIGGAIELSDGTWVMIDPHGRSWGAFPNHWNVAEVYATIEKYRGVIPGLIIQREDKGDLEATLKQVTDDCLLFLDRSREAEKTLASVSDLPGLAAYIQHSSDLELMADFLNLSEDQLAIPDIRFLISMGLAIGSSDTDLLDLPYKMLLHMHDSAFLLQKKQSWLTAFHAASHSKIVRHVNRAEMIDPVIDFASAEWAIAVAAINSCYNRTNVRRTWADHECFLHLSADQTTLYNALRWGVRRGPLAEAAAECLAAYPTRHALCQSLV